MLSPFATPARESQSYANPQPYHLMTQTSLTSQSLMKPLHKTSSSLEAWQQLPSLLPHSLPDCRRGNRALRSSPSLCVPVSSRPPRTSRHTPPSPTNRPLYPPTLSLSRWKSIFRRQASSRHAGTRAGGLWVTGGVVCTGFCPARPGPSWSCHHLGGVRYRGMLRFQRGIDGWGIRIRRWICQGGRR